jgi:hypothetical protein
MINKKSETARNKRQISSSNYIYVHGLIDKLPNESPHQTYKLFHKVLELNFGVDVNLNSFEIVNIKRVGNFRLESERIVQIEFQTRTKKFEFLKFISSNLNNNNNNNRNLIKLYDSDNLFVTNLNMNKTLHDNNSLHQNSKINNSTENSIRPNLSLSKSMNYANEID